MGVKSQWSGGGPAVVVVMVMVLLAVPCLLAVVGVGLFGLVGYRSVAAPMAPMPAQVVYSAPAALQAPAMQQSGMVSSRREATLVLGPMNLVVLAGETLPAEELPAALLRLKLADSLPVVVTIHAAPATEAALVNGAFQKLVDAGIAFEMSATAAPIADLQAPMAPRAEVEESSEIAPSVEAEEKVEVAPAESAEATPEAPVVEEAAPGADEGAKPAEEAAPPPSPES